MLYSPLRIGNIEIKNRIIAEPIVSNSGDSSGLPTKESFEIYKGYAGSGAGLVVIEQHAVHPWGRNKLSQFRLYGDAEAAALEPLTALFREAGVPVAAQLNFSGAGASGKALLHEQDFKLVSPSGTRNPRDLIEHDSHALEISEINAIIDSFAKSAIRAVNIAKYSGGVQIYACHGYLLGQFLSPLTNHRSDLYGGDIKSRARLLFEVVQAVRSSIPKATLSVRLGASDQMPGRKENGLILNESIWVAKELAAMGVDWLGVSGNHCIYGIGENDNDTAYFSPYAKAIHDALNDKNVPVDCAGGIRSSQKGKVLLNSGVCDLIGIGRPLLKDKNFLAGF
jgi:2,4-dienoyl-CoA reductase-like NADH-dependent reductase (Old Yellow Enzyme family)